MFSNNRLAYLGLEMSGGQGGVPRFCSAAFQIHIVDIDISIFREDFEDLAMLKRSFGYR